MFNESFDEVFGEEMREYHQGLIKIGKEIADMYEKGSGDIEKNLRSRGDEYKTYVEALVSLHTGIIGKKIQMETITTEELPDETKPLILKKLEETKNRNIGYMIEKDIKKGILSWFNDFAKEVIDILTNYIKTQIESEDDLSVILKQSDEKEPSKSDVLKMIDDALDRRDFKRVAELNKMLDNMNESLDVKDEMMAKKTAEEIAGLFMKFIKEVAEKIISEKSSR